MTMHIRTALGLTLAIAAAGTLLAGEPAQDAPPTPEERRAQELDLGQRIFHRRCVKCHGAGRSKAPVLGRPGDWEARVAQPEEVLIRHALEGHSGRRGRMPPKGGFSALSDDEVTAAVRYVFHRGRWLARRLQSGQQACTGGDEQDGCRVLSSNDSALLRFLWALRRSAIDQ